MLRLKHLVVAGGGASGLVAFGALKTLSEKGLWSRDDLESIDATSIGAVLAIIVALRYDWNDAETYLVKRPWHHVIKPDLIFLRLLDQRGIWGMEIMTQVLTPLLLGKGLTVDSTLQDLFTQSGVDVHLYAVEMKEQCELVDISHRTHPTWRIIEAVYASSCVPVLFAPFFKDGVGYVDGGMLLNYPLQRCQRREGTDCDAILGINTIFDPNLPVQTTTNFVDYMLYLMQQLIESSRHRAEKVEPLKHEINVHSKLADAMNFLDLSSSEPLRKSLIEEGVTMAKTCPMYQSQIS
jgi:predicted acylesterase/phospholipase RssA